MKSLFIALSFVFLGTNSQASQLLESVRLIDFSETFDWTGDASTTKVTTTMKFAVSSGGCTSSENFRIFVDLVGKTQRIQVIRSVRDTCKSVPHEKEITLTSTDLKLSKVYPVVIENPVMATGSLPEPGEFLLVE